MFYQVHKLLQREMWLYWQLNMTEGGMAMTKGRHCRIAPPWIRKYPLMSTYRFAEH